MFGFFNKKSTWSNTMDLIRDLARVPQDGLKTRVHFDKSFEKFVPYMERSGEWIKYECPGMSRADNNMMGGYKFMTTVNQGNIPKVMIEIVRNPARDASVVTFTDLEKVNKYSTELFASAAQLAVGSGCTLNFPYQDALDALKFLIDYEEWLPMPAGSSQELKVYEPSDFSAWRLGLSFCFSYKVALAGKTPLEGLCQVSGYKSFIEVEKLDRLPWGFDRPTPRIYERA